MIESISMKPMILCTMERNNRPYPPKIFPDYQKSFYMCLFLMHILSFHAHFSWREIERNKELMINYIVYIV